MSRIERFQVGLIGGGVTAEDIRHALKDHFGRSMSVIKMEGDSSREATEKLKQYNGPYKQQPAAPIQFVYDERTKVLRHIDEAAFMDYLKCTVEQIGAVLYVRGE